MAGLGDAWKTVDHPRDSHGRFRSKWSLPPKVKDALDRVLDAFSPRTFRSQEEANRHVDGWAPRGGHGGAVRKYLDGGWRDVNEQLRRGDAGGEAEEIDRAMSGLPDDLIVSRRVTPEAFGLSAANVDQVEEWTSRLVRDPAFASVNVGNPIAGDGRPGITMAIAVPKGTPAFAAGDGGELVLGRDLPMRITRVQRDGEGGYTVLAVAEPGAKRSRALGRKLTKAELGKTAPDAGTPEEPKPGVAGDVDLEKMTVARLRDLAAEKGIKLPSKGRKADLIAKIREGTGGGGKAPEAPKPEAVKPGVAGDVDLEKMTVARLRDLAAEKGIKLPSKGRKADLIAKIRDSGGGGKEEGIFREPLRKQPVMDLEETPKEEDLFDYSKEDLYKFCNRWGLVASYDSTKLELVDTIRRSLDFAGRRSRYKDLTDSEYDIAISLGLGPVSSEDLQDFTAELTVAGWGNISSDWLPRLNEKGIQNLLEGRGISGEKASTPDQARAVIKKYNQSVKKEYMAKYSLPDDIPKGTVSDAEARKIANAVSTDLPPGVGPRAKKSVELVAKHAPHSMRMLKHMMLIEPMFDEGEYANTGMASGVLRLSKLVFGDLSEKFFFDSTQLDASLGYHPAPEGHTLDPYHMILVHELGHVMSGLINFDVEEGYHVMGNVQGGAQTIENPDKGGLRRLISTIVDELDLRNADGSPVDIASFIDKPYSEYRDDADALVAANIEKLEKVSKYACASMEELIAEMWAGWVLGGIRDPRIERICKTLIEESEKQAVRQRGKR